MSLERMSICIFASAAMVLTDVPPPTVPTVNVVFGSVGVRMSAIFAIARPMPWIALGAEGLEAVAARAVERHLVAVAAGAEQVIDAIGAGSRPTMPSMPGSVLEDALHAAQVAELFLADVADEQEVAGRLDLVVVQHLDPGQQHRQPARVVGDAGRIELAVALLDLDVGAGREHGVEVRRDDEQRPAALPLRRPTTLPSPSIAASARPSAWKRCSIRLGARLLLERRRLDLGQLPVLGQRARVVGAEVVEQLADRRRREQAGVGLCDLGRNRRRGARLCGDR